MKYWRDSMRATERTCCLRPKRSKGVVCGYSTDSQVAQHETTCYNVMETLRETLAVGTDRPCRKSVVYVSQTQRRV